MFTATANQMLPTTVTGSWPRPDWFTEGLWGRRLSTAMADLRYREQFTDAVSALISDQERAGLDILTNGDYHADPDLGGRSWVQYPLERLGGISQSDQVAPGRPGKEWTYPPGSLLAEIMGGWRFPTLVDKVSEGAPFEYDRAWRIAQARTDRPVKFGAVCAQATNGLLGGVSEVYGDNSEGLLWDIATEFNRQLRALAAAGCTAIQVEEPLVHVVVDSADPAYVDMLVELFNHEVAGLDQVEVWVHTCWGNPNMQKVVDKSSYENAASIYMERMNLDVWTVEAKDNPYPLFPFLKPYRGSADRKVAVGVVSHRDIQVETPDEVAATTREALEVLDPDQVVLSSNCGFGRGGFNRLVAFYKAAAIAQGANIVRSELGFDATTIRGAAPGLQIDPAV
jgi:5-methyltetrahydropteroyltriglutamate--homocysteine methyltransferase